MFFWLQVDGFVGYNPSVPRANRYFVPGYAYSETLSWWMNAIDGYCEKPMLPVGFPADRAPSKPMGKPDLISQQTASVIGCNTILYRYRTRRLIPLQHLAQVRPDPRSAR